MILKIILAATLLFNAVACASQSSTVSSLPESDRRLTEVRHLNLTYSFQALRTKDEWLRRAAELRQQILVSAGLLPAPLKTPLNAQIFGKIDRGDHTVEKVYFESRPGFYVTGNLYRPKNISGKVPAVLLPHGHSYYGRLSNNQIFATPVLATNFAKSGFVAFTYDMVGYNDSAAISHQFAAHKEQSLRETLWAINLLGLQLWNSIRSIDFLETLPEVDTTRIGCTGESGGATQTFLLAAVDDRIKVSAPVNMISSTMQGGSNCENAPNLRIETNNMEIGSLMAPRPMLMVAATGDWTKLTPTVEYPAVRNVYQLLGAEDRLATVQMDAPHNYNQQSREAVYGWFAHWFQGRAETTPIKEKTSSVATLPELLVFYGRTRPANELNEQQLTEALIASAKLQLQQAMPSQSASLSNFKEQFGPAYKFALMAEVPRAEDVLVAPDNSASQSKKNENIVLSRRGKDDRVELTIWKPLNKSNKASDKLTLIAMPHAEEASQSLIDQLVKAGQTVAVLKCFAGHEKLAEAVKIGFFTTYNRTDAANRVQDILTAIAYLKSQSSSATLNIIGQGEAGLWTLLARGLAPEINRMVIDANLFDNNSDEAFLKQLPIPGIRRAGDFTTAVTLGSLTPLLIHNTGGTFQSESIANIYRQLGKPEDFQKREDKIAEAELVKWLAGNEKGKRD